ncbi:MAG: hypothetical protein ACRD2O_05125 [Terriglobia bacterium]
MGEWSPPLLPFQPWAPATIAQSFPFSNLEQAADLKSRGLRYSFNQAGTIFSICKWRIVLQDGQTNWGADSSPPSNMKDTHSPQRAQGAVGLVASGAGGINSASITGPPAIVVESSNVA